MPPVSKRRKKHDDEPGGGNVGWPEGEESVPDPVTSLERVIATDARNPSFPWSDKLFLQAVTWPRNDGLTSSLPSLPTLPDGRRLKELRESVGVELRALAVVLGVAPSVLTHVETGAATLVGEVMEQEKAGVDGARRLFGCIEAWSEFIRPEQTDNNNQKEGS